MSARRIAGVAAALLALAACGDNAMSAGKTEQSSAAHIAAALDTCAQNHSSFARNVCASGSLAALDSQVQRVFVAASANVSDAGAQMLVRRRGLTQRRAHLGEAKLARTTGVEADGEVVWSWRL